MTTKEQVIAWAREAGATPYTNRHYPDRPTHTFNVEQLERFATLVRNAALEEAANACDDRETVAAVHHERQQNHYATESAKEFTAGVAAGSRRNAKAIRNLKDKA